MAPKKRRGEEAPAGAGTTTTRVTRSSTRLLGAKVVDSAVPAPKPAERPKKRAKKIDDVKEPEKKVDGVKEPAEVVDGSKTVVIEHW